MVKFMVSYLFFFISLFFLKNYLIIIILIVALSRVRSIDDLSLQYPINKHHIKVYSEVKSFYENLQIDFNHENNEREYQRELRILQSQ